MSDDRPGPASQASQDIGDLLRLMAALRHPESGCPWDVAQDFATIAPYTIEEAYEVADAIARGDLDDLRDELADLLLQVVFHSRIAEERGAFTFGDVVEAITAKLIRRHPHVFGDAVATSAADVKGLWDAIKRQERRARTGDPGSALDGVALGLPALMRADKLARKAAAVGFTWDHPEDILDKVDEEMAELRAALADGDPSHAEEELGDALFTLANLARHQGLDPESALREANRKFERRFRAVEAALARAGRTPAEAGLAELDRLWNEVKAAERSPLRSPATPPESA